MTLNEIVYDIMELMRGSLTDDEDIDPRQVAYWVRTQRALWLSRDSAAGEKLSTLLEQDLGCVAVEAVDSAECSLEGGCMILRTTDKIPTPLTDGFKPLITRVGPIDKTQRNFSFIPYERSKYIGYGRFNSKEIRSFIMNGYVYLMFPRKYKEPSLIRYINIRGIFENPEDVAAFSTCEGLACYTNDSPYPLPMKYIDYMKGHILKNYSMMKMMVPSDEVNDADGTMTTQQAGGNNAKS